MAIRKPLVLINGEKQQIPDTDSVPNADKLDGKTSTYFATAVHTHMIDDVTNLQTELNNKSNIDHNHDTQYLGKTEKAADSDKLDGNDSTYFATATDLTSHTSNTNNPHNVTAAQLGAANILTQIKTVDGAGSGLDADTVDGIQASSFLRSDTGEMNLSGITFLSSLGNRIIKSIGIIDDAKAGLILFAKVYSGTILPKQGFVGKLFADRGGIGGFNISFDYDVVCTTAYNSSILTLTGNHTNCYLVKVNYNGDDYYGVYSQATAQRKIILDGFIYNYNLDGNGNPYIFIPDASGYTVTKVDSTQIYNNQNQVYTQNNVVGTVSQSGGVPTGAIIERGSNANGEYIKFADGTMICTKREYRGAQNFSSIGNIYESSLFTWTLPASFISLPVYGGSWNNWDRGWVSYGGSGINNEQTYYYRIFAPLAYSPTSVTITLFAIGRWY